MTELREYATESTLTDMINSSPVGKELCVMFEGIPKIIDVEFNFVGGWVIKQSLAPGMELKFVKGEGEYLEGIKITLTEYEGLK
ncbi:hypothetical protein MM182_00675 [Aeromonas sp. MR19]|uniref:hypothetical protein n=1 Tax=Aeromonas sp. MR19 TaxID=2923421 RepID=UPI001F4AE636|nr:hypothetical protein [Aeromonas sp. MR19]MCH7373910.1 hypothetical protein [Aeromonas sp. MR19]